jgi:hypothetical protein
MHAKKVWDLLKKGCMPEPSKEEWYHIADEFNKRANFPNCIGALHGKHTDCEAGT